MTVDQIAGLGSAFTEYLRCFGSFFLTRSTFAHLKTYCNGLLSDLFLPEDSWDQDRDRCKKAHIPDDIIYRPKWKIALEQVHRAIGNGIGFNWLTFDEYYGSKPAFLFELDRMGQHYVGEVPKNFLCFGSLPKYRSLQRPFAAKRVDNIVIWGKPFAGKKWRTIQLQRKTLGPQAWQVKAEQVWLSDHQKPTERTYWLIVARNPDTGETKYFISNAPPRTALTTLIKVAFTRWGIEHVFRIVKSEIGFSHFEGRSYRGLMRHMTLCQLMMLFIAEQTNRMRGEKSAGDDGADRPSTQRGMPIMATPPLQKIGD